MQNSKSDIDVGNNKKSYQAYNQSANGNNKSPFPLTKNSRPPIPSFHKSFLKRYRHRNPDKQKKTDPHKITKNLKKTAPHLIFNNSIKIQNKENMENNHKYNRNTPP